MAKGGNLKTRDLEYSVNPGFSVRHRVRWEFHTLGGKGSGKKALERNHKKIKQCKFKRYNLRDETRFLHIFLVSPFSLGYPVPLFHRTYKHKIKRVRTKFASKWVK
jgi:hypothetical protein